MNPWLVLVAFTATLNLLLFIFARARWDAFVAVLALAALVGTVLGDLVAGRTGVEPLRIGSFHFVSASLGAQLAMLIMVLLTALGPSRREEGPE